MFSCVDRFIRKEVSVSAAVNLLMSLINTRAFVVKRSADPALMSS